MAGSSEHYFTGQPGVARSPRTVEVALPDVRLTLQADAGVFSGRQLDPGTRVLLEEVPQPPAKGDVLDLGTGYGPIALVLAARRPKVRIWAVDVNLRALELARENAANAGMSNVVACLPDEVPEDTTFRAIYSNPPVRVGKAALHALLERWLVRLAPSGSAYLVVQRNLGSDSLARWLNEQGFDTVRMLSRQGYRLLKVSPRERSSRSDS